MRSSKIVWMRPKSNDKCPYERKAERFDPGTQQKATGDGDRDWSDVATNPEMPPATRSWERVCPQASAWGMTCPKLGLLTSGLQNLRG